MDLLTVAFLLLLVSVVTGFLGSLLGLGGGFLLVPAMTLALGIDIKVAVAVSIVAVVATSTGSGAASVRRGIANTRLGMFLEVATALGAIAGAFLALAIGREVLLILFGLALLGAVPFLVRPLGAPRNGTMAAVDNLLAPSKLRLAGRFENQKGGLVAYQVNRPALGLSLSWFAGVVAGLLGIGGGIVKVPTMHGVMGVPMRVAVGTSNFMIGVTASAAALVYFSRGAVDPILGPTAALGVVVGTRFGARLMERVDTKILVRAFAAIMIVMALSMFLKAAGVLP